MCGRMTLGDVSMRLTMRTGNWDWGCGDLANKNKRKKKCMMSIGIGWMDEVESCTNLNDVDGWMNKSID